MLNADHEQESRLTFVTFSSNPPIVLLCMHPGYCGRMLVGYFSVLLLYLASFTDLSNGLNCYSCLPGAACSQAVAGDGFPQTTCNGQCQIDVVANTQSGTSYYRSCQPSCDSHYTFAGIGTIQRTCCSTDLCNGQAPSPIAPPALGGLTCHACVSCPASTDSTVQCNGMCANTSVTFSSNPGLKQTIRACVDSCDESLMAQFASDFYGGVSVNTITSCGPPAPTTTAQPAKQLTCYSCPAPGPCKDSAVSASTPTVQCNGYCVTTVISGSSGTQYFRACQPTCATHYLNAGEVFVQTSCCSSDLCNSAVPTLISPPTAGGINCFACVGCPDSVSGVGTVPCSGLCANVTVQIPPYPAPYNIRACVDTCDAASIGGLAASVYGVPSATATVECNRQGTAAVSTTSSSTTMMATSSGNNSPVQQSSKSGGNSGASTQTMSSTNVPMTTKSGANVMVAGATIAMSLALGALVYV